MKTHDRLLALALAAGIAAFGVGRGAQASELDARIESSARKSYVYQTYLKDDAIRIESADGQVTLTGTVADPSHRGLAEDTVKGLPGVKSVINRLELKEPQPPAKSDDWISAKVKAALLFHSGVSGQTQVFVKDGVVTLKGSAANQAEKELATEYAKDIDGVSDVRNEMVIAAPAKPPQTLSEKVDDASISAQVKWALLTHRSTSALRTSVETQDGVVTVQGTAQNISEKNLVTKLVTDIPGVKNVRNEMTIGG